MINLGKSKADFEARVRRFNERSAGGSWVNLGGVRAWLPSDCDIARLGEFPNSNDSGFVEGAPEVRVGGDMLFNALGCWFAWQRHTAPEFSAEQEEFFVVVVFHFGTGLTVGDSQSSYDWLRGLRVAAEFSREVMMARSGRVFSAEVVRFVADFVLGLEDLRVYVRRCGWDRVRVAA